MKIVLISTDMHFYSHGVRAISTYLKQNGHETIVLSMPNIRKFDFPLNYKRPYSKQALKNMVEIVKDCDLIGISSLVANLDKSKQIINEVKPLNIPIVWGGIFPTTYPEYCIKYCDIICIGEGEQALCELADKIEGNQNYFDVKNFWFRQNNGIIKNPIRPMIENLDNIPPDYDLETNFILGEDQKIVKLTSWHFFDWLYYQGSRGCCFSCKYCCNYQLQQLYEGKGSKFRKKSVKVIIKELKELKEKFPTVKYIWFTDDDINLLNLEEVKEFSELYKKEIDLPFKVYMSPPTINEEKLKLFLAAGLMEAELGVQTGSDRVNKEIYGRPIFRKDVLDAAKILNRYKDSMKPPAYQIITANPYENREDVLDTISLLREIPPPYDMQPFGLVFFPGTPLYYKAVEDGYIKKFEDSKYNLDYCDLRQHINPKIKNFYLNCILYYMEGYTTKFRHGLVPRFALNFLLNNKIIDFFDKNHGFLLFLNRIKDGFNKKLVIAVAINMHYNIKGWIYSLVPRKVKELIKSLDFPSFSRFARSFGVARDKLIKLIK